MISVRTFNKERVWLEAAANAIGGARLANVIREAAFNNAPFPAKEFEALRWRHVGRKRIAELKRIGAVVDK